jgi:WD40 repeat protein
MVTMVAFLAFAATLAGADPEASRKRVDPHGDTLPEKATARLGSLRWRHSSTVYFVAYLEKDRELLTIGQDGTAHISDAVTCQRLRSFETGEPETTLPAVSRDHKMLATVDKGGAIRLWDLTTGKAKLSWKPLTGAGLLGLLFSPDGFTLAVKSADDAVRLYRIRDGKEIATLGAGSPRILYNDHSGRTMLFSADGESILTSATDVDDDKVHVALKRYDSRTGKEMDSVKGPETIFQLLALFPDGKTVAFTNEGIIRLWHPQTGKEVRQLNARAPVTALAFSPDGKCLVSRATDQVIRVWDPTTGEELRRFGTEPEGGGELAGVAPGNLAFSSDGKRLAAGTMFNTARQWDVLTGKPLPEPTGHHGPILALAISPDGKTALTHSGGNQRLYLWEARTGKAIRNFGLHGAGMGHLSADGCTFVLTSYAGKMRSWDTSAGKEIKQWDVGQNVRSTGLSHDGKTVAVRTADQVIRLCDSTSGRQVRALQDETPLEVDRGRLALPFGNSDFDFGHIVFSPDDSRFALLTHDAKMHGHIQVCDPVSGQHIRKIEMGRSTGVAMTFSADGRVVFTSTPQGEVIAWEVVSGKRRYHVALPSVSALAATFDGKSLIVGGRRGELYFVNSVSGTRLGGLDRTGHEGPITALATSRDGKTLASGSEDSTALIYDLEAICPVHGEKNRRPKDIGADAAEALWKDLGSPDAGKAHQPMLTLANSTKGVALLQQRLKPTVSADAKRLAQLLADLDADQFTTRKKANDELGAVGEGALEALREELKTPNASLEKRRLIERLIDRIEKGVSPVEVLRQTRALEILEQLGTQDARIALEEIAKGARSARLTRDVRQALKRIAR